MRREGACERGRGLIAGIEGDLRYRCIQVDKPLRGTFEAQATDERRQRLAGEGGEYPMEVGR